MFDPFGRGTLEQLAPSRRISNILTFKRSTGLLSSPEQQAFEILTTFRPTCQHLIAPQVHLLQVFDVDTQKIKAALQRNHVKPEYIQSITEGIADSWKYEMGWKSIDFLVCAQNTTTILGAIEIDDPSHIDPARQACDLTKNVMFASIGKPLLRFTNSEIATIHTQPFSSVQTSFQQALKNASDAWDRLKITL